MQTMQVEASELFIMATLLTFRDFGNAAGQWCQVMPRGFLFITPTCGEHSRGYDDFFIGSGRYRRDSGHEAGPYVMASIPPKLDLIPRLHMVCFGAELARIGKLGLVIHWPTTELACAIWFQDMFRWSDNITSAGIAFIRVLQAHGGGTVRYYKEAAHKYRLISLDRAVDYIKDLEALVSCSNGLFGWQVKSILKTGIMAQYLQLQPWIMQGALEWLVQNGLDNIKRDSNTPGNDNCCLWTLGDPKDAQPHRDKFRDRDHRWEGFLNLAAESILNNFINQQKVVFLTSEFRYLGKSRLPFSENF